MNHPNLYVPLPKRRGIHRENSPIPMEEYIYLEASSDISRLDRGVQIGQEIGIYKCIGTLVLTAEEKYYDPDDA